MDTDYAALNKEIHRTWEMNREVCSELWWSRIAKMFYDYGKNGKFEKL